MEHARNDHPDRETTGASEPSPLSEATPSPSDPLVSAGPGPDADLIDATSAAAGTASEQNAEAVEEEAWGTMPLSIPADRMELLQFMVADLQSVPANLTDILKDASDHASREEAGRAVVRIADEMAKVTEFFEFSSLVRLTAVLRSIGQAIPEVDDQILPEIVLRARGIGLLIEQFCATLGVGMEIAWPLRTLERRVRLLMEGRRLHPDLCAWHGQDPDRVLELDGVTMGADEPPTVNEEAPMMGVRGNTDTGGSNRTENGTAPRAWGRRIDDVGSAPAENESTIRIGRRRIDEIFDSIRQLVLTKNQILSSARAMQANAPENMAASCAETVARAEQLDRLISGLRVTFAEARMQSVDRLLERYEKLTRDIGNITGKKIELQLLGTDTHLDKFVLEELAEPLNQIVRTACHSIEAVEERRVAGKPEHGTITIRVSSQGSKVVFEITDDGAGMSDLCTEDHPEIAELVGRRSAELLEDHVSASPLAGIGPMLRRMNANVELGVDPGAGTRLTINIPIRGAVISAVLVRAGGQVLAIPLTAVTEIIPAQPLLTPQGQVREMCNIRGRVLAAFDMATRLGRASRPEERRLAVVLKADRIEAAAVIDAVLGHQEFVVEDLSSEFTSDAPVLGATIRDDGEVCMIIDCFRMLRCQHNALMPLAA